MTGALYARVGGAWVPIAGSADEVYIGADDPGVASQYELWYDTDAPSITTPSTGRNLLDNGQMMINQRVANGLALGNGTFLADRWSGTDSGIGAATYQYNTIAVFGVPVPVGRPRPANVQSIAMTTTEAAGSLSPNDWMYYGQNIEGLFLQHLNWGTADARQVTLSFDIYSPIATTYVIELYRYETTARTIGRLLPVPAGWSTQSLTFPGDTVTPITNDNTARLAFWLWIGAGSTFASTALQTSWGNKVDTARATGVSNAFAAQGGPLAMTNVQLEVGSIATPYEVRRFDDELAHCMRYYEKSYPYNVTPGSNAGLAGAASCALFDSSVPTRMRMTSVDFRVTKRISPLTYQAAWALDGSLAFISAYNAPATKLQIGVYGTHSDRQWAADYMTLNVSAAVNTYYNFHWAAGCEI